MKAKETMVTFEKRSSINNLYGLTDLVFRFSHRLKILLIYEGYINKSIDLLLELLIDKHIHK